MRKVLLILFCIIFIISCENKKCYRNTCQNIWTEKQVEKAILKLDTQVSKRELEPLIEKKSYDTLLSISKTNNLVFAPGDIYRRYGCFYYVKNDFINSINYFDSSYKCCLKSKDTLGLNSTLQGILSVRYYLGINDGIKESTLESLKYFDANKYYIGSSTASFILSNILLKEANDSTANFYAKKALDNKLKINDIVSKSDSLLYKLNLINTCKKDSAQSYFKAAYQAILSEKNPELKLLAFAIGSLLYVNSNNVLAKSYSDSFSTIKREHPEASLSEEVHAYRSAYFKSIKQWDSAFSNLTKVNDIIKETFDTSKLKILGYQDKLQRLEENKEIEEKKEKIVILSVVLILLIITTILFYRIEINKKKKIIAETNLKFNKILREVNEEKMEALAEGTEKERSRLASELHDRLGSLLAMANHHFSNIEEKFNDVKKENELMFFNFKQLINHAIIEVRELSKDISSSLVTKLGLVNALIDLNQKFEDATGIVIKQSVYLNEYQIPTPIEVALFRIIQESLNNILKHSKATNIHISLTKNEDSLVLIIEDNGIGFNTKTTSENTGLGLKSMKKRMREIGGILTIESNLGRGTIIIAEVKQ